MSRPCIFCGQEIYEGGKVVGKTVVCKACLKDLRRILKIEDLEDAVYDLTK